MGFAEDKDPRYRTVCLRMPRISDWDSWHNHQDTSPRPNRVPTSCLSYQQDNFSTIFKPVLVFLGVLTSLTRCHNIEANHRKFASRQEKPSHHISYISWMIRQEKVRYKTWNTSQELKVSKLRILRLFRRRFSGVRCDMQPIIWTMLLSERHGIPPSLLHIYAEPDDQRGSSA